MHLCLICNGDTSDVYDDDDNDDDDVTCHIWMKELRSESEASIIVASGDSAVAAEADVDTSQTAADSEKYASIVAQFKVCFCNILIL